MAKEAGKSKPFVYLTEGCKYAVRIHNRASFDVAVDLRIDGHGLFAFSPKYSHLRTILVPAKSSAVVTGWMISPKETRDFVLGRYDGRATEKRDAQAVGCIGAVFKAAWAKNGLPPEDENARDVPLSTQLGESGAIEVRPVERIVGRDRAPVYLFYAGKEGSK